jgi:chloramphenicol-sensitive protein RarD
MAQTSSASAAVSALPLPSQPVSGLAGRGYAAGVGAFVIWGLFPLYLKGLVTLPGMQIIAHRIVWSCVFLLAWMAVRGELGQLREAIKRKGVLLRLTGTALLISANWIAFIWAINNGRVLDVSLGYYIGPLINIVLGVVVLSERLDRTQWIAVAFAAAGVAYLILFTGHVPWAALTVAISFGLYGLFRKKVSVDALPGLTIETILLVPFAAAYVLWCQAHGAGAFGHMSTQIDLLLVGSGIITAIPLFLFAYGARQIPYSTMGVLQFIGPSLQLLSGVFVFGEAFDLAHLAGFALIWIALAIYAAHGFLQARSRKLATA